MGKKQKKEIGQLKDSTLQLDGRKRANATTKEELEALRERMIRHFRDHSNRGISQPSTSIDDIEVSHENVSEADSEKFGASYDHIEIKEHKLTFLFGETKKRREARKKATKSFYEAQKAFRDLIIKELNKFKAMESISGEYAGNLTKSAQDLLDKMAVQLDDMYVTVRHKEKEISRGEEEIREINEIEEPDESSSYRRYKDMKENYEVCQNIVKDFRRFQLYSKYGVRNITELYKMTIDPKNNKEIGEIRIFRNYTYETDEKTPIESKSWKDVTNERNGSKYVQNVFRAKEVEDRVFRENKLKGKIHQHTSSSPFSNCHWTTFCDQKTDDKTPTDGEGGWFGSREVKTILQENDYYPIAGWSLKGAHPNPECGRKGYSPIARSDRDPITPTNGVDGRKQRPKKGDVIVYWQKNTATGEWFFSHTVKIISAKEQAGDEITGISKMGLWGEYEHRASDLCPYYGEAWTIYHSDKRDSPLLSKRQQQKDDPLSLLRKNDFRVIASSDEKPNSTLEAQPQRGDKIVYWIENPSTGEWSPVHDGSVHHLIDDEIFVESMSRDNNLRIHRASSLGCPYTRWEICRIDNPPDNTDPSISSMSDKNV